ncbi:MAG: hypothetical protein ABS36_12600 [Acidobacteria bacterium SCN 69-37]|nr:MAG: hypothetical protein ABS36_12600 [Acidobacteria bacterium SCN 69-37]
MNVWLLAGLAAASILYSSVGHAGASGYLAVMALTGVDAAVMKPGALVLNLAVATIATFRFARAGHFSWPLLWPFALTSVPFAFIGGAVQLPGHWYKQAVGLVLLFAATRLFLETRRQNDALHHGRPPLAPAMASGAAIGLLAGLTGTGGGIFLSPLLLFTGWSGTRESGGVSAAFILANSASGLAGNLTSIGALPGEVWVWTAIVIVGGVIGSDLGSRRIAVTTFRRLLAAVLVVAGLKLLLVL